MESNNFKMKRVAWKYAFAVVVIFAGLILAYNGIGQSFLGFASVGTWLIYVGFVMLALISIQLLTKKKRLVDERMEFVAAKAGRVTFIAIILFAFIVMIIDGIRPIALPYSYVMSYFISGIILVYFISYRVLLRYN